MDKKLNIKVKSFSFIINFIINKNDLFVQF